MWLTARLEKCGALFQNLVCYIASDTKQSSHKVYCACKAEGSPIDKNV